MPVPISERGYAHPELLAEADWLQDNLGNPALRIIDTRSAELYAAGHIPGAVSMASAGGISRAENGDMGSPEDFARLASALGVDATKTVVVYDAPSPAAGMLAWAFLFYGHSDVKMLDGGFEKWSREARPTSTAASGYLPAVFEVSPGKDVYCSLEDAKASHGQEGTIFWDTRRRDEYDGSMAPSANTPRPGHIPNAVHLDWVELLDPESRTVKPAAELHALLGSRGITPESVINCY